MKKKKKDLVDTENRLVTAIGVRRMYWVKWSKGTNFQLKNK